MRFWLGPDKLCFGVNYAIALGAELWLRKSQGNFARDTDSLLEGTGFEPSVPPKAPGVLVVSVLVRAWLGIKRRRHNPPFKSWPSHAVPIVRIHLSPAASLREADHQPSILPHAEIDV
jgi:hypothetical protein